MARNFDVPDFYRSNFVKQIKLSRLKKDPHRRDFSPTVLDLGSVIVKLGRHFGFCFGVENAIEIAYRTLSEQRGKRIFLLSEIIHNPEVNRDLLAQGVKFLMTTDGQEMHPWKDLTSEDIVIVPAFGTTIEIQDRLRQHGIDPYVYDTTCPFVEKVWKKAAELGAGGFSVVIHGKRQHEETKATFSHSYRGAPSIIVENAAHATKLAEFISGSLNLDTFDTHFAGAYSTNFDPTKHLEKLGVVNQTTMLASDTQEIVAILKNALILRHGSDTLESHFADTRDTLCYATNENQNATKSLIASGADIGIVVGGYKSSNTSHLVELCDPHFPTFFVEDERCLLNSAEIRHFHLASKEERIARNWLAAHTITHQHTLTVAITAGASCPDATVDRVIRRLCELCGIESKALDAALDVITAQELRWNGVTFTGQK